MSKERIALLWCIFRNTYMTYPGKCRENLSSYAARRYGDLQRISMNRGKEW